MSDTPAPTPSPAAAEPNEGAPASASLRLSAELRKLLPADPAKVVTIKDILHELDERGLAIMLILFTVPFMQPLPLFGLSTPFGFVLGLLGFSMAMGREELWLPQWIIRRQVPYSVLKVLVEKGGWAASKVEHLLRARLASFTLHGPALRIHGTGIMIMAFLLALPLPPFPPATNTAPAISILLMGLALLEKDGFFVLASYLGQLITVIYFCCIGYTAYAAGNLGWSYLFPHGEDSQTMRALKIGFEAGCGV